MGEDTSTVNGVSGSHVVFAHANDRGKDIALQINMSSLVKGYVVVSWFLLHTHLWQV